MGRRTINLDNREIVYLYEWWKLSSHAIARRVGTHHMYILKLLRLNNVKIRKSSDYGFKLTGNPNKGMF